MKQAHTITALGLIALMFVVGAPIQARALVSSSLPHGSSQYGYRAVQSKQVTAPEASPTTNSNPVNPTNPPPNTGGATYQNPVIVPVSSTAPSPVTTPDATPIPVSSFPLPSYVTGAAPSVSKKVPYTPSSLLGIAPGSSASAVVRLQECLVKTGTLKSSQVTGRFDTNTYSALTSVQRYFHKPSTGRVDQATDALFKSEGLCSGKKTIPLTAVTVTPVTFSDVAPATVPTPMPVLPLASPAPSRTPTASTPAAPTVSGSGVSPAAQQDTSVVTGDETPAVNLDVPAVKPCGFFCTIFRAIGLQKN